MRTALLLLITLILTGNAFSSELFLPSLLPGASQYHIKNTPLPALLEKEWDQYQWVNVVKEWQGATRYVKSCVELDKAHQDGEYAPDSAGMGREQQQMEYCQNIRRLILAKPAQHNEFVFPLCLEKPLHLELVKALKSPWGSEGLLLTKELHCSNRWAEASVSYDRVIEPASELGGDLSSGSVHITYLVQGDFDNDGWLDLIAAARMGADWNRTQSAVHGVVKISRVRGVLTVTKFEDL